MALADYIALSSSTPTPPHRIGHAIGLFGGRFDPIHRAHLTIALAAANTLGLSQIRWIVTATPPHKSAVATPAERLAMVRLALQELNDPRMVVDESEIQAAARGEPNYTADTLKGLLEQFPHRRLIWILGEDQLRDFNTWSRWDWLIQHMELAICARPDAAGQPAARQLESAGAQLHWIDAPPDRVSSTQIREAIRGRHAVTELISPSVGHYIQQHGLYISA